MKTLHHKKEEDLSIVSAVEALSNIADLEFEGISRDPLYVAEEKEPSTVVSTVRWLHQKNAERMMLIIRDKMSIVLNYLKHFYNAEKRRFARKESVEGLRTIMMLVDEAADNLDRYTQVFLGVNAKSVKTTKEFLSLCSFYRKKILPIATHTRVASWIGALPFKEILESASKVFQPTNMPPVSVLGAELEGVKDDREYELLLLRQPDGSRFFSPKLVRSIKLATDVERATLQDSRIEAELLSLIQLQASAEIRYLLGEVYPLMDAFFRMSTRAKGHEVYMSLYKACVALLEAAVQSIRQPTKDGTKSSYEYLKDFCALFNDVLHLSEFQRMLAYPPHNEYSWEHSLFRLTQAFSSALIAGAPLAKEFVDGVNTLYSQSLTRLGEAGVHYEDSFSDQMNEGGSALRHLFKSERGSKLSQMIKTLEERGWSLFEPLLGESLPHHLFDLSWRGALIPLIRMPSPTVQEYINKARIAESFHIAIQRYLSQKKVCLFVNLQERNSWRDSARSIAIEECSRGMEGQERFHVLTQNRSNDFYNQSGAFEDMHLAEEFKEQLLSHVLEVGNGSLWPLPVDDHLTKEVRTLIQEIHTKLYGGRNVITRVRRLEFIELVYDLMVLRAIGNLHPDVIFVSCKDGLDSTLPAMSSLFCLQASLQEKPLSFSDEGWLRALLFGLPLINRHRLLFPEKQEKFCSFARFLENTLGGLGKTEKRAFIDAINTFLPHEIIKASLIPASGHRPMYPSP